MHSDLLIECHAAAALPFYLKDLASGNTKCQAHVVILTTDWRNQNARKSSNGSAYSGITLHILLTVLSTQGIFRGGGVKLLANKVHIQGVEVLLADKVHKQEPQRT